MIGPLVGSVRWAIVVALLLGATVRAEEAPPPPDAGADERTQKPSFLGPADPQQVEDKPYVKGWRAGSPPGERTALVRLAVASVSQRSEYEFSLGFRVGGVSSRALGQPKYSLVASAGVELYGTTLKNAVGDLGWLSLDYLELATSGVATLTKEAVVTDTRFLVGDEVRARVSQRFLLLRDGIDLRHRFPIAEEVKLDLAFGPTLLLGARAETVDVRTRDRRREDGGVLWALGLCPGARASLELHLPFDLTFRVGLDADYLPSMEKNPLSFTRAPSVDAYLDVHVFAAARWRLVELAIGWRHLETEASGGRVRQAQVAFQGVQATVSLRF